MSRQRRRFIPSFDRLEERWVPTGNVITKVTDGVLYISGDAEANSISIAGNGSDSFTLTGNDTTINGSENERFYEGIKSITINMKDGDDTVSVSDVHLRGAIEFQLGEGDDTLTIDNLHTRHVSAIYGQAGDDNISITDSHFHRSLLVWMGAGDDTFNMISNYFGRKSEIHGGQGTDHRTYFNNSFGKHGWIDGFETFVRVDGTLPQANADSATVDQGDDVIIDLADNDTASQGTLDLDSIVITQQPAHGTVVVHDDGTVTYSHNGSATTTDTFQYTIKDSEGNTSTAGTVSITVNPVDQAPVAANDTGATVIGGSVDIAVAANDTDADSELDFTTITFTQQPTSGTITLNSNGTVKYTHTGATPTTDTFKYTIEDLEGHVSNEATVTVTVTSNNAPVANNDSSTVAEGGSVSIPVSTNDTDSDGTLNLTSITITQQPANGSVTVNANGSVSYTHNGSETTSDSFKYTIKDDDGTVSNEATVNITITPVNDAPVAVNDSAIVNQNGNVIINLASNDTDADNALDLTSIVITQQPVNGSVVVNNDGTVTYTQNGSSAASDTFKYTIKDVSGTVSPTAATVTVTRNTAPVANNDTVNVATSGVKIIDLTNNDTDLTGTIDDASIAIVTPPANGTLVINNNGTVTYTHDGSATTSDSFTYTVKDNLGLVSNTANVSITIHTGNSAPVANNDSDTLAEGGSKAITILANDTDSDGVIDPATVFIFDQPAHGTVVVNANGTITYTHDGSETTADSFIYKVRDNLGTLSNEGKINVTITPVNDAPVAVNDLANVIVGNNTISINVASNDTDADGTLDLTSLVVVTPPQHGTFTVNNDGTISYTFDGSSATEDTFTYTIKDNLGLVSNIATVTISISQP